MSQKVQLRIRGSSCLALNYFPRSDWTSSLWRKIMKCLDFSCFCYQGFRWSIYNYLLQFHYCDNKSDRVVTYIHYFQSFYITLQSCWRPPCLSWTRFTQFSWDSPFFFLMSFSIGFLQFKSKIVELKLWWISPAGVQS